MALTMASQSWYYYVRLHDDPHWASRVNKANHLHTNCNTSWMRVFLRICSRRGVNGMFTENRLFSVDANSYIINVLCNGLITWHWHWHWTRHTRTHTAIGKRAFMTFTSVWFAFIFPFVMYSSAAEQSAFRLALSAVDSIWFDSQRRHSIHICGSEHIVCVFHFFLSLLVLVFCWLTVCSTRLLCYRSVLCARMPARFVYMFIGTSRVVSFFPSIVVVVVFYIFWFCSTQDSVFCVCRVV